MADDNELFETLIRNGVPIELAARAEEAARLPDPHAQIRTLISIIFWLCVVILTQAAIILGLLITLLS